MIRGQRKSFQINFSNMTEVSLDDRRVTSIVRSPKVQSSTSTDGKARALSLTLA